MRGDTHLRHHGQWRTCVKAACNAAALVASPQSKMKTSRFRHDPEMTPPERKVGCKNLHKTDQVQLGGCEWAPRLTLADVTVARICTKLTNVSKLFRILAKYLRNLREIRENLCGFHSDQPRQSTRASNPEARLKYLKYPSSRPTPLHLTSHFQTLLQRPHAQVNMQRASTQADVNADLSTPPPAVLPKQEATDAGDPRLDARDARCKCGGPPT